MVHFADVHPETLFVYDPLSRKSRQIYPQKNDPLRDGFSTRLEKIINKNQCAENNWAREPDRFETEIDSVEANDESHALAFHAAFGTEGFLTPEETDSSGQWYDDDYVYFYQFNPLRWREFSIYDLKPKFGTNSLKSCWRQQSSRKYSQRQVHNRQNYALNISSTGLRNVLPIFKASGKLGSYFSVSIALTVCRDTPKRSARSACVHSNCARSSRMGA